MTIFRFRARTSNGAVQTGEIHAASRTAAASLLQSRGLIVTRVEAVAEAAVHEQPAWWSRWLRPRSVDVELNLQQLAIMLRGGLTLLQTIDELATSNARRLRAIWRRVGSDIQAGASLSTALARQPCFPTLAVQLVGVGEKTGRLDWVLQQAAEAMSQRRRARHEVLAALFYPLLVVVLSMAVTGYMVGYLIPKLDVYLASLGKTIPAMTQLLIDAAHGFSAYGLTAVAVIAAAVVLAVGVYATRQGRFWCDRLLLRLPVVGPLFRLHDATQFSRTLALLLSSGVALTDALLTVAQLLSNRFTATMITAARERILQGFSLPKALESGELLTPMMKQMIAVGTQTGELDGVLRESADFHEELFRARIRTLHTLLMPVLTIAVGAVVGYVYIAFFMALFAAAA